MITTEVANPKVTWETFFLSYNLLVLRSGPTIFNKRYTYINGSSIIRKNDDKKTTLVQAPAHIHLVVGIEKTDTQAKKSIYDTGVMSSDERN